MKNICTYNYIHTAGNVKGKNGKKCCKFRQNMVK